MGKIISNLFKVLAVLVGIPVMALLAYDIIAIRPHLPKIEAFLVNADPQDAVPPQIIRDLIDASGGPESHATRLVTSHFYSGLSQGQWHLRNGLWRILLPLHFNKTQMYGFYSTLAYNGTDYGLNNFSNREYGKDLSQLSPFEAATTVAVAYHPSWYLKNRARVNQRAFMLLKESGNAP